MIEAIQRKPDARLNERLATRGFRFTRQRENVYAVLLRKRDNPTTEEVFIRVKHDMRAFRWRRSITAWMRWWNAGWRGR